MRAWNELASDFTGEPANSGAGLDDSLKTVDLLERSVVSASRARQA